MSSLSTSGSSKFSRKVEPDLSADANFDRSHGMYPGIGLSVANVWKKLQIIVSKNHQNQDFGNHMIKMV